MTYNEERQRLVEAGFTGFTTIGALMADTCAAPAAAGVYVVMRNDDGRYIWQLQDARELTVCWKVIGDKDPRDVEKQMIAMFKVEHGGRRPFANLKD